MKKIILASISILILSLFAFGQNKEISPCPSGLSVTGPSGLTVPGVSQTFTANVDKPGNYPFKYEWSIRGGDIIEGQGTSSIKVVQPSELGGDNLTTTVELKGLPEHCESTSASETTVICDCAYSSLVDEIPSFGSKFDNDIKARLDNFAVTLINQPNATGYILGYFGKNKSESSIKTELNKITDHLIKVRKFDASRITIATAKSDNDAVIKFWLVPAGASPPTP